MENPLEARGAAVRTMESESHRRYEAWRAQRGFELRDYVNVVLKRRFLLALIAFVVLTITAVHAYLETPSYRASCLIQIDWGRVNLVQDVFVDHVAPNLGVLYLTEERIMQSRPLAARVVEELKLWEHPVFGGLKDPPPGTDHAQLVRRTASQVLSMLDVAHVPDTQLMEVTFKTPDPELSAQLANELVRQYMVFSAETDSGKARDTLSFIRDKVEELQRDILEKERLLGDFNKSKRLLTADKGDPGAVTHRLEEYRRQLAQAEAARAAAEARYRSIRRARPEELPEIQESPRIRALREKQAALQEDYAERSTRFKPEWPEMRRLAAKLEKAQQNLDKALKEEASKAVGAARVDYETARERERILRESFQRESEQARELVTATADYEQLTVELENERKMLQGLLRRQAETDLSADLRERQPTRIRIVQDAMVPAGPFSPNIPMSMLAGLFVGLGLGVALAFVLEHADGTIRTAEDLRRWVPLPYLGMIPRYGLETVQVSERLLPRFRPKQLVARTGSTPANGQRSAYLPTVYDGTRQLHDSREILNERMKFLRGSLLLSTPGSAPRIILVTSAEKGAGKSFVSCNLGVALAQLRKKVLLIDSDLRNPRLHRVFGYRNRAGLTNVLTGQKALNDGCVVRTEVPELFLLMAGPKSPTPAELLASAAMEKTLQDCAGHFDFVVLDSAPLLPVFDSHALCGRCDAVLLVARSGVTSRNEVRSSLDLMEKIHAKVTGVVLNGVDLKSQPGPYHYGRYTY